MSLCWPTPPNVTNVTISGQRISCITFSKFTKSTFVFLNTIFFCFKRNFDIPTSSLKIQGNFHCFLRRILQCFIEAHTINLYPKIPIYAWVSHCLHDFFPTICNWVFVLLFQKIKMFRKSRRLKSYTYCGGKKHVHSVKNICIWVVLISMACCPRVVFNKKSAGWKFSIFYPKTSESLLSTRPSLTPMSLYVTFA